MSATRKKASAVEGASEPSQDEKDLSEQTAPDGLTPIPEVAALEEMPLAELKKLVREHGIDPTNQQKSDLIMELIKKQAAELGVMVAEGLLDIQDEGYGFLRRRSYYPGPSDVYVSNSQIRKFCLRQGDLVVGHVREPKENERFFSLLKIEAVNGMDPEHLVERPVFEQLVPIYPDQKIRLETDRDSMSMRFLDLIAPIGKGQRGLIVSPPKAGKTIFLQQVAQAVHKNYPDMVIIALLIDERPEEVTDFQRSVQGEVVASTFDERPENHILITEMVLEKAKRMVEVGKDVIILLDSITRLARAYNLVVPSSGKTLSGGLDPNSLHKPKRFFGSARNIEGGGSLTIVATALIDTGSRLDDVIYEEFKGTGNMEVHLDRNLANRRIYPAIDAVLSGTRHEELLLSEKDLNNVRGLRRAILGMGEGMATERLIQMIKETKSNREMLLNIEMKLVG